MTVRNPNEIQRKAEEYHATLIARICGREGSHPSKGTKEELLKVVRQLERDFDIPGSNYNSNEFGER